QRRSADFDSVHCNVAARARPCTILQFQARGFNATPWAMLHSNEHGTETGRAGNGRQGRTTPLTANTIRLGLTSTIWTFKCATLGIHQNSITVVIGFMLVVVSKVSRT